MLDIPRGCGANEHRSSLPACLRISSGAGLDAKAIYVNDDDVTPANNESCFMGRVSSVA